MPNYSTKIYFKPKVCISKLFNLHHFKPKDSISNGQTLPAWWYIVEVYCLDMQVQYSSDHKFVSSQPGMGISSQNLEPSLVNAWVWAMARAIFTPSTSTWNMEIVDCLLGEKSFLPEYPLGGWSIQHWKLAYRTDLNFLAWHFPVTWAWAT